MIYNHPHYTKLLLNRFIKASVLEMFRLCYEKSCFVFGAIIEFVDCGRFDMPRAEKETMLQLPQGLKRNPSFLLFLSSSGHSDYKKKSSQINRDHFQRSANTIYCLPSS